MQVTKCVMTFVFYIHTLYTCIIPVHFFNYRKHEFQCLKIKRLCTTIYPWGILKLHSSHDDCGAAAPMRVRRHVPQRPDAGGHCLIQAPAQRPAVHPAQSTQPRSHSCRWEDGERVCRTLEAPDRWALHSADEVTVEVGDVAVQMRQMVSARIWI
jgi:hypothetical protein